MSTSLKDSHLNVLLIVTDQQMASALSAFGNPWLHTPNMDRLVREGTSFTACYCPEPVCGPSRAGLLTGRMPLECGVYANGHNIRSTIPNIGQWLLRQKAQQNPCYAGKWHVRETHTAFVRGFHMLASGINCQGQLSDTSVGMACEAFLRNEGSTQPFLLAAMFTQPHDICEWAHYCTGIEDGRYPLDETELPPLPPTLSIHPEAPEAHRSRCRMAKGTVAEWSEYQWRIYRWGYYRLVEMVDGEIGRLLEALDDSGLAENTLVVFCSDHGEGLGELGMITKNFLYDSAARVPLAVRLPGTIPAGHAEDRFPVSLLDIFPTVCDYCDIPWPAGVKGISLRPYFEQGCLPERQYVGVQCLGGKGHAIRSERFKYIRYRGDQVEQFFDMRKDPAETANLAKIDQFAAELQQHRKWLSEWLDSLDIAECIPEDRRPDFALAGN